MRGSRILHSPAVVVYAMTTWDVQNIVKCATKLNYVVNALSGGHSYEGYSLGSVPNNIIINFGKLNHIHFNVHDKIVKIGPGARLGPIYYKLYQNEKHTIPGSVPNNIIINFGKLNHIHVNVHDKIVKIGPGARLGPIYYKLYQNEKHTIPGGSCPWVGIGGLTLGGGYGLLARLHGLLVDQVVEMKVVNAQGDLLAISTSHEPDLFWALRGAGGGSFAIVTEFTLRLVRAPLVVTRLKAVWHPNATKAVMKRYQLLMFNARLSNFSNNIFLQMLIVKEQIAISITHYGPEIREFNRTVSLMLATLPTPKTTNTYQQDWLSFVYDLSDIADADHNYRKLLLENATLPTYEFKSKHLYFDKPISDHSIDQLTRHLSLGTGRLHLEFNPWDGYINTIPIDATAFPHRQYKFGIQFTDYWNHTCDEQRQINWLERIYTSVHNDSTKHSYINYIDRDVPNWMDVYYGSHKQRLRKIKQIYDKDNRFHFERSVL
ncbi:unnamed protein product [Adineta ricciae]|uniref:FAD-binding PCMH-type domain-containing protein n=1 Tax=Adineta ricciae TaxID=249248 RepID=A0A814NUP6_ADIRI|nr:unnamed protein product [Adineta ricciae]